MCEARRAEYVRLLDEEGMNFTQAAHAVASRNAPARRGATAGRAPREGTRNPWWTGIVPPWTNPRPSIRAT